MFNNLISPVMFVNLFVTSINFGVNIIEIARMNDLATLTSGVSYLGACLIQLFVFYWHSNEVTVESDRVSYGTFESDWSIVNYKLQREVVLLAITTSKILLFAAGPFNDLTLSTFLGIIRASYSFYALLSKTNN
ncbi:unnamed protein product [Diatraea saccharalis]|uniref:Uncharacterized protein n=1 Tax=Diatraea saccharalis TaxID=40085 RepID=A0A9P0FZ07_9NEOP|nr:unnamed protein product [Diatraea saccharalis]